ncbi:MAG: glycosyltransferase [Methylococcales bacterium]|nr:glycosyltransferase [Methylococcaceae bacterium]
MNNQVIESGPTTRASISIITATYNAAEVLPRLISSLRSQTDKDFEWVISDGASTDGTVEIAQSARDLNLVLDSRPDFGIYDALNRAIQLSTGEYYLVLGADDLLYPEAIASFRRLINTSEADLITAQVLADGVINSVRRPWPWLYGQFAYVSSHAVGTLIRKSLHDQFGLYSRRFPIAADQLFLKKVGDNGARILKAHFVAGEFSTQGTSGNDILGTLTEGLRVQLMTGEKRFWQVLIFFLRLLKNYRRL